MISAPSSQALQETCLPLCSLSRQYQLLEELLETNQPSSSQLKMCGMLIGVFAIFGLITFLSLQMFDHQSRQIFVGYINVASLISMFASPLFIINLVIKTKSVEFMPFHLSLATFLMSISFFAYGLLLRDFFIYIPNGLGSVLGIIQLLLYGHYREKSREDYTLPLFVS
ncbi:hypothetical protein M5K25_008156 [Dendrobium thyrsiflorum]|uniref:Uncharacterized protein n=1 Tax=Dendrobium thyrsiflorum TaxID=117978 RepID=A0ABD0V807_DENTH